MTRSVRIFASETLTVDPSAEDPTGLTRTKIDNVGGSRASYALLSVKAYGVGYSFVDVPTAPNSHAVAPGNDVEIHGYENLVNLQLIGTGAGVATVFISYGA